MHKMVQLFATQPWVKQTGEDDLAYEMFKMFRDTMPMERPEMLPILSTKFGIEDFRIKDIARKHDWLHRCASYDVWLDASRRQAAIRARSEAGANMVRLSQDVVEKAEKALNWLVDNEKRPSYREVVEMVRLGIELNKAGLGLQGLATGKETVGDQDISGDSPGDLIQAAVQVNVLISKQVKGIAIKDEDVIDGESKLIEEDTESGGSGESSQMPD